MLSPVPVSSAWDRFLLHRDLGAPDLALLVPGEVLAVDEVAIRALGLGLHLTLYEAAVVPDEGRSVFTLLPRPFLITMRIALALGLRLSVIL